MTHEKPHTPGWVYAAAPVAVALAGIAQGLTNTEDAGRQVRSTEKTIAHRVITQDKPVSVLLGGKATITLQSGKRFKITAPLMEHSQPHGEHDHAIVLGRNPNSEVPELAKGYYGEKGGIGDNEQAEAISYSLDGQQISAGEALDKATKETVGLNSLGQFVVATGQEHAGEAVGVTTPIPTPDK